MAFPAPKKPSSAEWQKGLNLAFQLSGWLVGPLVVALFLGQYLDEKYRTEPWIFLGLTGFAFLITLFGITMETMKFMKEVEREAKNLKEKNNNDRN